MVEGIAASASAAISIGAIVIALKANSASKKSLDVAMGGLENELRRSISDQSDKINAAALAMRPLLSKKKRTELTPDEVDLLEAHEKSFAAYTENWLNAYEEACSKYLDRKVDVVRFKKAYVVEVRQLVESQNLKARFDPTTSRYKAILKVYTAWENHEG